MNGAMADLILVHGAWHGAWCWQKLTRLLLARGHRVLAPDLPGMGADSTPAAAVTLDLWAHFIIERAHEHGAPPVLIGHSRGGIVLSRAAELEPEAFARLIYIAAFLLSDGLSMVTVKGLPMPRVAFGPDGASARFEDNARRVFYNTCSAEDASWAAALLCPEPMAPGMTPMQITPGRFGRVPRDYIHCLQDNAIPHPLQEGFCRALPCARRLTMDTDHSPFISAPEALAAHLDALLRG